MDRRTSLAALGALATHALFPRVLEAWHQTPAVPLDGWRPRTLTPDQGAILAAIADTILPDTDTPGAVAAGVHVFVDLVLAECVPAAEREVFGAGLAAVDAACRADHGRGIAEAAPEARTALLTRLDAAADPFVRTAKGLVVLGYGSSKIGATQALAYDAVPGRYRGCVPLAPGQRAWATR
jgi:hypothetical protein